MQAITYHRTDTRHPELKELIRRLDQYLAVVDGDEHAFYDSYNQMDSIRHIVIACLDGKAVGCGALKEFDARSAEIKRMFTLPEARNQGVASGIVKELEKWCAELGYERCVLETGKRQTEAVRLYNKLGYQVISNYGQYAGIENSVCFEKILV